ncbi:MAG: PAS domain S-box protein [Candidatus Cloacimonetes bacterium]|nr:PAS domain S-box protein [Candidatus Cloacimonadota bacterium]
MKKIDEEKEQLLDEIAQLKERITELEKSELERESSETALLESEDKFRELADMLPQAVYETDTEGNLTYVNRQAFEMFGYTQEMLDEGVNFLQVIIPDDHERALENTRNILQGKDLGSIELTALRKDGATFPVLTYTNVIIRNNNPVGMRGILIDITERMQAEDTIKKSEEKYRTLVENLEEGICSVDDNETFIFANQATADIFGCSKEEIIGKSLKEFTTPEAFQQVLNETIIRKEGRSSRFELEIIGRNGGKRLITVTSTPIISEKGEFQGSLGILRDITRQKKEEGELRSHRENLEELVKKRTSELEKQKDSVMKMMKSLEFLAEDVNEARQELADSNRLLLTANEDLNSFSHSVSHDLRAPLRAIDGFSQILYEDYHDKLSEDANELLFHIRKNTKYMNQLINDLLAFSRITRGQLNISETDLMPIVQDVFDELKKQNPERQIEMEIDKLPPAFCDTGLIRIAFVNLLSNAFKFTRRCENALIKIGCTDDGFYYVKDNGVGFDMKYADKIFGVFQRLHSNEEFEGSGVGMSIVQRIIRKHGGDIHVEAEVDKGAVFYFSLKPFI